MRTPSNTTMNVILAICTLILIAVSLNSCTSAGAHKQQATMNLKDSVADGLIYNTEIDTDSIIYARDTAKKTNLPIVKNQPDSLHIGDTMTGAKGGLYVVKVSKKTGKIYRKYLKK